MKITLCSVFCKKWTQNILCINKGIDMCTRVCLLRCFSLLVFFYKKNVFTESRWLKNNESFCSAADLNAKFHWLNSKRKMHRTKLQKNHTNQIQRNIYKNLHIRAKHEWKSGQSKAELIKIFGMVQFVSKRTGNYYVDYSEYDAFYWASPPPSPPSWTPSSVATFWHHNQLQLPSFRLWCLCMYYILGVGFCDVLWNEKL